MSYQNGDTNMGKILEKKKEPEKKQEKEEEQKEEKKEQKEESKEEKKSQPGFFSRTWTKVKTGTSKLKKKAVKAVSKDPDEMPDDEFNEHLQDMEASGETGYASNYYSLLEELKTMPSLMALSKQADSKDVAEAVSENKTLDNKDQEEAKAEAEETAKAGESKTEEPAKTEESTKAEEPAKVEEPAKAEETTADKIKSFAGDGKDLASEGMSIYKSHNRAKELEKLSKSVDPNSSKGRQIQYMQAQAKKESASSGFDMAQSAVNTINKAIGKFGSASLSNIAGKITGFINMALGFGKDMISKRMEKKSVKNGLKGILGGTDVYKQLKGKYKLHGGDMRRAIRVAANQASTKDLVDADKDKLSEEYASKAGDNNKDVADYMGLAGGRDR